MNNMQRDHRGEGQRDGSAREKERLSGHRPGFTLLELLLAVGMTTLLMAAVYGAMSTYWNLALDSREEITRSQIARSIMHNLSRDIRSVTFVEQVAQSSSTSGSSSSISGSTSGGSTSGGSTGGGSTSGGTGGSSPGTGSSSSSTSATTESVYKNGLIGTQRDLILYVSSPEKDLNYVALPDTLTADSRNSDLMIVRWIMADQSGSSVGAAIAATTQTGPGGVAGLARGAGGVNGFGRAIEMDDIGQQVEVTSLIAAEVEDIVFEYFDGVDWLAEWNSGELNRMPQAIRIELTLREPPSDDDRTSNTRALPSTTHQLVVPIPVAQPFVQETAL